MTLRTPYATHLFRALADPTRRAILARLRRGEISAGAIASRFDMSRPAVSRHIRVLRRARLVRERREGRLRLYTLQPEPLRRIDEWLSGYRRFWRTRLQELKRHVEAGGTDQYTGENG
jgi:DNA-binding transcriptional ArsR family regulator